MPPMIGLKNIIDYLNITLLNIELYTVRTEWNYRNVNNPYSRIYYITSGTAQITHHNRQYQLSPGNLYLIPCYTTVNMSCPKSLTHYYIHFTSRLQTGLDIFSMFDCDYHAPAKDTIINKKLLDRLLKLNPNKQLTEYDANVPIYQQALDRTTELDKDRSARAILETNAIMRLLISAFFNDNTHPQIANTIHGLKRFESVIEYIHDHLDTSLTISQLAKIANLNPTYFSNLFAKLFGTSPLQYINKRRIEKAQQLLLGTDETLFEISQQIGITDEYYFSRLFKKHIGLSPDHYRKQEQSHYQR